MRTTELQSVLVMWMGTGLFKRQLAQGRRPDVIFPSVSTCPPSSGQALGFLLLLVFGIVLKQILFFLCLLRNFIWNLGEDAMRAVKVFMFIVFCFFEKIK